jgi:putative Mg2+ transporter-C (MgtC) family protein
MWLAGAVGVACGGGYYSIALMATVLALAILTILAYLERRIEAADRNAPKEAPPARENERPR